MKDSYSQDAFNNSTSQNNIKIHMFHMPYLLLLILLGFPSCTELSESSSDRCRIKERVMKFNTFSYNYRNDTLISVTGKDYNLLYSYNEKGKIKSLAISHVKANYLYDQNGVLNGIEGHNGPGQDYRYQYNSQGEMIAVYFIEIDYIRNIADTVRKLSYEYQNGLPVKMREARKGKPNSYETYFKYDTKKNPLVNIGFLQNGFELMYGYPVGNCKHNLVEAVEKDIATGKVLNTLTWEIEYTSDGYPARYEANGNFTYDCD